MGKVKNRFIFLGKTDYIDCLKLQEEIFRKKIKGEIKEDYFLITEHFPIYTLGKTTKDNHLPRENLAKIIPINRGGSITFHGENQIVVYPIINLINRKLAVKKYIHTLEEIIIRTLKALGIKAYRRDGLIGVFSDKGKIAFIGVRISKFTTMHGFSINYDVDKRYFSNIIPCGLQDRRISNITDFSSISKAELVNNLYKNLRDTFGQ